VRRVDQGRTQALAQRQLELGSAAEGALDQLADAVDHPRQVDGLGLQAGLAGEGEQLAGQPRGALGRGARVVEVAPRLLRRRIVPQPLEIAGDHLEHVVEVVGEAGGQLPDRLHLLRLAEVLLGVAAARDVELAGEEIDQLALVVVDGAHENGVPSRL
jgi:hypothetical protein